MLPLAVRGGRGACARSTVIDDGMRGIFSSRFSSSDSGLPAAAGRRPSCSGRGSGDVGRPLRGDIERGDGLGEITGDAVADAELGGP
jgi:hypothetical protein